MGELNLDRFERAWGQASEQHSNCGWYSTEKEEITSRCSSAAQNEMTKLDRESKQRTRLAYNKHRKLRKHPVVV